MWALLRAGKLDYSLHLGNSQIRTYTREKGDDYAYDCNYYQDYRFSLLVSNDLSHLRRAFRRRVLYVAVWHYFGRLRLRRRRIGRLRSHRRRFCL